MDFSSLMWIVFVVLALQPLLMGRWFAYQRLQAISAIEKKRGTRVITMIHRQEKRSLFGFAVARHIDLEDAQTIIAAIKETPPETPIDLVLHTPGGLVLAAMQIARAIESHPAKATVFVPVYAMSGGTLIALAADEIVLGEFSVLGPIDPQIAGLPALLVVLDQLFDLLADDLALIGLLARRDSSLKQVPVDLGLRRLLGAAYPSSLVDVTEDLESDELVDVAGGQRGLIELHAKLLHFDCGNADHRFRPEADGFYRPAPRRLNVFWSVYPISRTNKELLMNAPAGRLLRLGLVLLGLMAAGKVDHPAVARGIAPDLAQISKNIQMDEMVRQRAAWAIHKMEAER
jgi:hypothetical protein